MKKRIANISPPKEIITEVIIPISHIVNIISISNIYTTEIVRLIVLKIPPLRI